MYVCLTVWKSNSQSLIEQKCPPFSQCNVEGFAMCHEDISEQHKHTHTERSASSPLTIQLLQSMDDDALSEALIRNILINI